MTDLPTRDKVERLFLAMKLDNCRDILVAAWVAGCHSRIDGGGEDPNLHLFRSVESGYQPPSLIYRLSGSMPYPGFLQA